MEKLEFVIKFMRQIAIGLVFQGIMSIAFGLLIFIYPDLLGMLVGLLLILSGTLAFALAYKVFKYSKFAIDL